MKLTSKYKLVTIDDINEFEKKLDGLKLPEDYKQHMLSFNGGYSNNANLYLKHSNKTIDFEYFHPLKYGASTLEKYLDMRSVLPKGQISIGAILGGRISLGLSKENYGQVFISFEDVNPEKVANTFTEFLNSLHESEEEEDFEDGDGFDIMF